MQAGGTASGTVMKNIRILKGTNTLVTLAIVANVMYVLFSKLIILNKQQIVHVTKTNLNTIQVRELYKSLYQNPT
jgi:hypothetical protein